MFTEKRLVFKNRGESMNLKSNSETADKTPAKGKEKNENLAEKAYNMVQSINTGHNDVLAFINELPRESSMDDSGKQKDMGPNGSPYKRFGDRFNKFINAINGLLAKKLRSVLQMPTIDTDGVNPGINNLSRISADGIDTLDRINRSYEGQLERFEEDWENEKDQKHASVILDQINDLS